MLNSRQRGSRLRSDAGSASTAPTRRWVFRQRELRPPTRTLKNLEFMELMMRQTHTSSGGGYYPGTTTSSSTTTTTARRHLSSAGRVPRFIRPRRSPRRNDNAEPAKPWFCAFNDLLLEPHASHGRVIIKRSIKVRHAVLQRGHSLIVLLLERGNREAAGRAEAHQPKLRARLLGAGARCKARGALAPPAGRCRAPAPANEPSRTLATLPGSCPVPPELLPRGCKDGACLREGTGTRGQARVRNPPAARRAKPLAHVGIMATTVFASVSAST